MAIACSQKLTEFSKKKLEKKIVSRDDKFVEQKQWDWKGKNQEREANELHNFEERVDHPPSWGIKSLLNIYQGCNLNVFEPA